MKMQLTLMLVVVSCGLVTTVAQEPGKTMRATGRVVALDAESITVKPGSDTLTLAVDASTRVDGKRSWNEAPFVEGREQIGADHRLGRRERQRDRGVPGYWQWTSASDTSRCTSQSVQEEVSTLSELVKSRARADPMVPRSRGSHRNARIAGGDHGYSHSSMCHGSGAGRSDW